MSIPNNDIFNLFAGLSEDALVNVVGGSDDDDDDDDDETEDNDGAGKSLRTSVQ